jgi:hypothetical protein
MSSIAGPGVLRTAQPRLPSCEDCAALIAHNGRNCGAPNGAIHFADSNRRVLDDQKQFGDVASQPTREERRNSTASYWVPLLSATAEFVLSRTRSISAWARAYAYQPAVLRPASGVIAIHSVADELSNGRCAGKVRRQEIANFQRFNRTITIHTTDESPAEEAMAPPPIPGRHLEIAHSPFRAAMCSERRQQPRRP